MKTKVAHIGVFVALALIFGYIETLIPINVGIPGFKMGLSNIMIVIALYKFGIIETFFLGLIKVVLAGMLFGSSSNIIFGLIGIICSISTMYMLKRMKKFSVITISMMGGVAHNIGQINVAMIILESINIIFYLPILMLVGMFTGIVIGIIGNETIKRIKI